MRRLRAAMWVMGGVAGVGLPAIGAAAGAPPHEALAAADRSSVLHPNLARRLGVANEPVKAWVYFTDKGHQDAADLQADLAQVASNYNPRATARRVLRRTDPGLFDIRDLPVSTAHVEAVRRIAGDAAVRIQSRWLNAVSVHLDAERAERIAALPFVRSIEPVLGGRRTTTVELNEDALGPEEIVQAPASGLRGPPPPFDGLAAEQNALIDIDVLHAMGFTGDGVIVGVMDTGFKRTHAAFNAPGHPLVVIAEYDFIFDDAVTVNEPEDDPTQHNHGSYCLGLIGAYLPGAYVSGAYDATFVLAKTEDIRSETPVEEDNYVAGLEFVEMQGADIMSASLGYIDWYTQADLDGQTAVTTIGVNIASANGLMCFCAAGNEGNDGNAGTSHLIAPADAPLAFSIGAADFAGASAGFTSDGPTADGRVKPELMAWGVSNATVRTGSDTEYRYGSGTSFATPMAAAAAACVLEAHPSWTLQQMRDYLLGNASDFAVSGQTDPLFVRGYGIIQAAAGLPDCNHNGLRDPDDIAASTSADCNGNGVPDECEPPCGADFDGQDCVGVPDIFAFLAAWFGNDASADFDGSGLPTAVPDIFAFLAAWFAGC